MNEWMECLVSRQAVWQNAHLEFGEATPINKKPPVVLVLLDANAYVQKKKILQGPLRFFNRKRLIMHALQSWVDPLAKRLFEKVSCLSIHDNF